jgi:hypothetical protein
VIEHRTRPWAAITAKQDDAVMVVTWALQKPMLIFGEYKHEANP